MSILEEAEISEVDSFMKKMSIFRAGEELQERFAKTKQDQLEWECQYIDKVLREKMISNVCDIIDRVQIHWIDKDKLKKRVKTLNMIITIQDLMPLDQLNALLDLNLYETNTYLNTIVSIHIDGMTLKRDDYDEIIKFIPCNSNADDNYDADNNYDADDNYEQAQWELKTPLSECPTYYIQYSKLDFIHPDSTDQGADVVQSVVTLYNYMKTCIGIESIEWVKLTEAKMITRDIYVDINLEYGYITINGISFTYPVYEV